MSFSDVLAIAGITFTIIAIPVGILIGRNTRQKPDLRCAIDFDEVVAPADWLVSGGLTLKFGDAVIDRVCRSYVAIWNHKGDTIKRADALSTDPLRVELDSADSVLQLRVVARSREQNDITAAAGAITNVALIDFAFLDARDGAVIEILHHKPVAPVIRGTVMGTGIKRRRDFSLDARARARYRMGPLRRLFSGSKLSSGLLIGMVVCLAAIAAAQIILFTDAIRRLTSAVPISPADFELRSPEGQQAFINAVQENVPPDFIVLGLVAAFGLLPFFLFAHVVWGSTKSRIPSNVLAEEIEGASDLDR